MEARYGLEVLALARVERCEEGAVLLQRSEGSEFRAILMLVLQRLGTELLGILGMSKVCCEK